MKPNQLLIFQKSVDGKILSYYDRLCSAYPISINLICPDKELFSSHIPKSISITSDESILEHYSVDQIAEYTIISGWYKQQIIKILAADYFFKLSNQNIVIADGDTLISARLINSAVYLIKKKEPQSYLEMFDFIPSLQCYKEIAYLMMSHNLSPIVNFGIWNRDIFNKVFKLHKADAQWHEKIIKAISKYNLQQPLASPGFSEYLLMAAASLFYSNVKVSSLKCFRRADLVFSPLTNNLSRLNHKYDMISYERFHDRNLLKRVLATSAWFLNISIV